MSTQKIITDLLLSTKRKGMNSLIEYLVKEGFFESPASTKYHGAHPGGLAEHSLAVYNCLINLPFNVLRLDVDKSMGCKPLPITPEAIVIACLLHDICKVGAYVRTKADDGWTNRKGKDKGHAVLSVERIKRFIILEPLEELMILYHMGLYGANEFAQYCAEFPLCGDHAGEKENPTKEEKAEYKKARYGKSLRNAWYHNAIVKFMYLADEIVTAQEKLKGV